MTLEFCAHAPSQSDASRSIPAPQTVRKGWGKMKKIIIAAGAVLVSTAAFAQFNNYGTGSNSNSHYVQPHTRSNGSYVGGHYQTNPDSSTSNNYGTPGNFNSHTGKYKGF